MPDIADELTGKVIVLVWEALGPTLGWPVYMSFLVISAGLYGFATGEWKQVKNGPIGLQLAGMAILCVAVFIFSRARP